MSSEAERDQMLKIGPVTRVHALATKADLRLIGIGQIDKNAQFHVDGFISREELLELMRLGAVGGLGKAYRSVKSRTTTMMSEARLFP
jgi:DNA-binding transcriptional regulator LsrR (DeoR family)